MRGSRLGAMGAVLALSLGALTAHAATYSMTGKAATGAGLFVKLPAAADASCPSLTALKTASPTMVPQMAPVWPGGPYATMVPLQPNGCIPGGPAVVTTNGTGGFTFPVNFFSQPPMLNVVPIPNTPMVVQLATSWTFNGPPAAPVEPISARRNAGAMGTTFGYAPWAAFQHGAWANQSGRVAPNFTACAAPVGGLMFAPYPTMGAKVSCTYPSQGSIPAYVKNIAGPGGGFGGTFGLVLNSTGGVGDLAVTIGPYQTILVNPLQTIGSRPGGRGYAAYSIDNLAPGDIWLMYMLTMPGPYGVIGMVSTFIGPGPPATNMNWGFPWTTGNVVVRGTGQTIYGLQPAGGSFSLTGFDTTTTMGQRNIQLVAGAVAQSNVQGNNGTANYSIMRLPEPSGALPLVTGAVLLLAVGALRAARRR